MKAEPLFAGFGDTPMTELSNCTFFDTLACQPDELIEPGTESSEHLSSTSLMKNSESCLSTRFLVSLDLIVVNE
jgi:hypothetical protein